jgi:hypothetical protein
VARPRHYNDYGYAHEVVPGVFVDTGHAVYIVDDEGEVVTWNAEEVAADSQAFTAALNAVALSAAKGAAAVRANIQTQGRVLDALIGETVRATQG